MVLFTQRFSYFTVVELREGFYITEIEECNKHKTAFEFNKRAHEWNSMMMGYKNSQLIQQRIMNTILKIIESEVYRFIWMILLFFLRVERTNRLVDGALKILETIFMKKNKDNI